MRVIVAFDLTKYRDINKYLCIAIIELICLGYTQHDIVAGLHRIISDGMGLFEPDPLDVYLNKLIASMDAVANLEEDCRFATSINVIMVVRDMIEMTDEIFQTLRPLINSLLVEPSICITCGIESMVSIGGDTLIHFKGA